MLSRCRAWFANACLTCSFGVTATAQLWKKIFLFVGVPGCVLTTLNAIRLHREHAAHEHHHEFIAYPHMRVRAKPFPWGDGDRSLCYNHQVDRGQKEDGEEHH
eukprot:Opistho-1_new@75765